MASCNQLQVQFDQLSNRLDNTDPQSGEYQTLLQELNTNCAAQVAQGCVPISLPSGAWVINGNGSVGQLNISFFGFFQAGVGLSIGINGDVNFPDAGRDDTITGVWNEDADQITFTRVFLGDPNNNFQSYTGYFGTNPSTQPPTIAGTFTESDVTSGSRTVFEWFAQKVA